jgi:hypothetical protein
MQTRFLRSEKKKTTFIHSNGSFYAYFIDLIRCHDIVDFVSETTSTEALLCRLRTDCGLEILHIYIRFF